MLWISYTNINMISLPTTSENLLSEVMTIVVEQPFNQIVIISETKS